MVAGFVSGAVAWVAALGESLVRRGGGDSDTKTRVDVRSSILTGGRLWEIVRPGSLLQAAVPGPLTTIYDRERPWLIIGETPTGAPIAVPLNKPGNEKWYAPVVQQPSMSFPGNRQDSQVELAHAWTLPATVTRVGSLTIASEPRLPTLIGDYFDAR